MDHSVASTDSQLHSMLQLELGNPIADHWCARDS